MTDIGGNVQALMQKRSIGTNEIGEQVATWETVATLCGFLDLSSGSSGYTAYNAKVQESTHLFLCDYTRLPVSAQEARMCIGGSIYDVMLLDDPMGLHEHLEIYLKYTGGCHADACEQ